MTAVRNDANRNEASHLLVMRLFKVAEILVRQGDYAENADYETENRSRNHDRSEIGYRETEDALGIA